MLGSFVYDNPTRLYFGADSLQYLKDELAHYGKTVQLVYGSGSIKKNGLYDEVVRILKEAGKEVVEDAGVTPNPTTDRVRQGCRLARESGADLLLAAGGGSCCDYAKAVSASVHLKEDLWQSCYLEGKKLAAGQPVLPVGCILTMAGTGSEMNGTAVLTDTATRDKRGCKFGSRLYPRFSILNPVYTMSLPRRQMVSGIFDIFCHICEQYFSGTDDNTSDYISEGLMRSVLTASKAAIQDSSDYTARSNLMWTASWALNSLLGLGKKGDWMVHKMGHAIGAYTNASHGMTLSSIVLPYYHLVLPYGLEKYRRFAMQVFDVAQEGRTDLEIAEEGLRRMEEWMRSLDLVLNPAELGVTDDMLDGIVKSTIILDAGYKKLSREDIRSILESALKAPWTRENSRLL